MDAYSANHLPAEGWVDHRSVSTTRMAPVAGPCTIQTREGAHVRPVAWSGFLAVDQDGYPIIIDATAETLEGVS